MPLTLFALVASFASAASAASVPALGGAQPAKRWDTSICDASTAGVPIPDSNTFNLSLEGGRQDVCWGLCVGDPATCTPQSQICFTFAGRTLTFDYQPVPGFTYTEAGIWLGLSAPSGTPAAQFTTGNGYCVLSADESTVHCAVPYDKITPNPDVLAGMCPNGDREGLVLYLTTTAKLTSPATGLLPAAGRLSCTDYPTCASHSPFWALSYRCTKCPPPSTPPPPPACATNVCFSTQFNSQPIPAGATVWLSAAFKPKFGTTAGSTATVGFVNTRVLINGLPVSPAPPHSFISLDASLQTCSVAALTPSNTWQTTAPLPGSGNTFFSAVGIPVPAGSSWAKAKVSWCGDIVAPGQIAVQIAAAVYNPACEMGVANPEACETHTGYHAGVPTGCLGGLVAGGTGGGGSNWSGSLSSTFTAC
ncbi:hypothetical protein C8A05DRAFT_36395 [Staphylotrichum tortipilum]|uniref:Uncharacterized protein n=1 Tax=Staphylotrichum tortipilum TaxID=2831512 RepID=A0AAN6MFN7_9PEZI|nr:hypothetical protein C8A05DRAFT_36395 [Staphylotrichum longicolle]